MTSARQNDAVSVPHPSDFIIEGGRITLRGRADNLSGVVTIAPACEANAPDDKNGALSSTDITRRTRVSRARLQSCSVPMSGSRWRHLTLRHPPRADERSAIPVRFGLPRSTPPGSHTAVFDFRGTPVKADIEVLEDQRLEFLPRTIKVEGAPGERVTHGVTLLNQGNVPMTIGALGAFVLTKDQPLCLAIHNALRKASGAAKDGSAPDADACDGMYQRFLDALLMDEAKGRTDLVRVRTSSKNAEILPGAAIEIDLIFDLPRDMAAGSAYSGVLDYAGSNLTVNISSKPAKAKPKSVSST